MATLKANLEIVILRGSGSSCFFCTVNHLFVRRRAGPAHLDLPCSRRALLRIKSTQKIKENRDFGRQKPQNFPASRGSFKSLSRLKAGGAKLDSRLPLDPAPNLRITPGREFDWVHRTAQGGSTLRRVQ